MMVDGNGRLMSRTKETLVPLMIIKNTRFWLEDEIRLFSTRFEFSFYINKYPKIEV